VSGGIMLLYLILGVVDEWAAGRRQP